MSQPASQRAEESVLGALMRSEQARIEILAGDLQPEHFYYRPYRLAFEEVVERYYADDPIDPLAVAEAIGPAAANAWRIEEREAIDKLTGLAQVDPADTTSLREHAAIVKRHHDYRELLAVASEAVHQAAEQADDPEEIAGKLAAAATRVVTGSLLHREILSYAELGRNWTRTMQEQIAAKAAGEEMGAHFGIRAVDDFVKGLRPTELMMLGGEPGSGKSALAWVMARNFATRQMRKPPERRVAAMILSLEMGEEVSSTRFAQIESGAEGDRLRTVSVTRQELREIASQWATQRELPIYVNHSGELRESQIKALVVDAIRRHNIGLLIVDHFRFIKTDERFEKATEADDQIVRFLKGGLAKDLNLAVICLAHTVKGENRRPVMDDLRGSKMISAFADVVTFMYWPWKQASQEKRDRGLVSREDYELIHDKVRQGAPGTGELWSDMSTMSIR